MVGTGRGRNEEDLARYFEMEYGEADVGRLLAQYRKLRRSFRSRLWHRLLGRLAWHRENEEATAFCLLPGPQNLHRCS